MDQTANPEPSVTDRMQHYTWAELVDASGCDFEDLTSSSLEDAGMELGDYADGTVIGDEIIAQLKMDGLL